MSEASRSHTTAIQSGHSGGIDELGRLGDRGIMTSCHSCFLSCDCSQLASLSQVFCVNWVYPAHTNYCQRPGTRLASTPIGGPTLLSKAGIHMALPTPTSGRRAPVTGTSCCYCGTRWHTHTQHTGQPPATQHTGQPYYSDALLQALQGFLIHLHTHSVWEQ